MNELEYRPEFSVTAEGRDITRALQQNLISITLTDNGGATAKADELQIDLLSPTLPLPKKGARLRVALGFNGNLVDKGWFVVCGRSSSGPPRKLTIYATAAPLNSEKQPGNVQSHKTRSWDDVTLGDIVKTVASDNGLTPKVADKLAAIQVKHVDQVAESDANLLTRLARTHNAVSKPSGGYWLFLNHDASATASGKSLTEITVTPEQCSRWTYSDGDRGAATGNGAAKKGKVRVQYFDEQSGETKHKEVELEGPDLQHPYTQPDEDQATSAAKSKSAAANRNERRMTLSGPCRPAHLPMTAEARVITAGFGEVEDQSWLVESLVYSLSSSGLSYQFSLVKSIKPKSKGKAKKPPRIDYGL